MKARMKARSGSPRLWNCFSQEDAASTTAERLAATLLLGVCPSNTKMAISGGGTKPLPGSRTFILGHFTRSFLDCIDYSDRLLG